MTKTVFKKILYVWFISFLSIGHIHAMDNNKDEAGAHEFTQIRWPNQLVRKLELCDGVGKITFVYCIPLLAKIKPLIGTVTCTCCNSKNLSENKEDHRKNVISLFKMVLADFVSIGYEQTYFSSRLLDHPPCLAEYVRSTEHSATGKANGHEYSIITKQSE